MKHVTRLSTGISEERQGEPVGRSLALLWWLKGPLQTLSEPLEFDVLLGDSVDQAFQLRELLTQLAPQEALGFKRHVVAIYR